MEKFESQIHRNELVSKLNQERNEAGREAGKKLLSKEQETDTYKASKIIKELKGKLPKEYLDFLDNFTKETSDELMSSTFTITDISDKLTLNHRLLIEAEILENFYYHYFRNQGKYLPEDLKINFESVKNILFPNQALSLGIKSGPDLFNEVSGGELNNNHNLTHVSTGFKASDNAVKYLTNPLDYDDNVGGSDQNEFWVAIGHNGYARQIDKPLIILSPTCLASRKFIKELASSGLDDYSLINRFNEALRLHENKRNFNGGDNIGYGSERGSDFYADLYRLLFLADYPMISNTDGVPFKLGSKQFKWSDISSKIVNFASGKMYERKYSDAERDEAIEDIKKYREQLREKYGIDYEVDKEKFTNQ